MKQYEEVIRKEKARANSETASHFIPSDMCCPLKGRVTTRHCVKLIPGT